MSESEWLAFFSLMEKVTQTPEETWRGKRRCVQGAAMELGFENCLDEFVGWFGYDGQVSD